ncbi:signal transduction histidine kinase/AraC-like DNA-binding protein/CheY-like chemotaxis protein/ABC-type xylose transport system substrate-binding protein [Pedobacter sp. W3I1]|uniref:substrate-binding domain-containing protein n=1 Tax=Pedobacter sp. W3I1 TaxID=3042291 RepID=UPI00277FD471|nr:substrate-binding domain-containing protein [Pedobacter sp. W3I1]MDQ0640932.1 signal transduction histidine kinase/AraC-like DNA-binding protein/CheY-like chemotaxis protein/ABC-type xylose transport system substrate-binding protein [Pedobacter sp. W3I1]
MAAKFHTLSRIFSLIILIAMLCGCGEKKKETEYVIGFSQCVGSDLWRKTMLEEMKMELSLHPGARLVYRDANNSSSKQISQVGELLKMNVDLLIISPNEARPLTPIVDQAYSSGIPVVVIDRKTSSSAYTAYVGADNYQIGKMAGQYVSGLLKGKGNIMEIMGLPGSSPTVERERGFAQGLRKTGNIRISHQVYGDWLKSHATRELLKMRDALDATDLIFAHNDQMAAAASEVISKLGIKRKISIVGVDALPGQGGGLQMIDSKIIDASMLYPTGGREAISTAFRILEKESVLKENILQSVVIDSSNVQLMKLQWNKFSSQQRDIERQQSLLFEQRSLFQNQQIILNVTIVTLVLSVVFGGLAFFSLLENRKINKNLEANNLEILDQRNKLIELSKKAQEATEAKLNFFTNISHEFRTPLTLILSPLEDLINHEKINALAGKNLKLINKNVFRLLRLINQLIEYRKIEYGKMRIRSTPNNLIDFISDIIETFQLAAKKQNIDLRLYTKESDITVWFDVNMLDKVMFNLISNALKFTPVNGKVHITLTMDSSHVYIKVEDNGPGMDEEETLHIFEHFYQAESNAKKGSGLGLSLSKELMTLLHGELSVESQKWRGTIFTVSLPLGSEHLREEEKQTQVEKRDELYENAKIYTSELEYIQAEKNSGAFRQIREQSILVIEDNADLLYYLGEKLGGEYEVFISNTGESGINSAYEQVPDLIICDVVLPDLSGKKITEKLKSDIRTSHIPIILLTAQGSVEQQINGFESMADAYIVKPFNYEYLLATVRNLMKNRLLLKSHYTSDISSGNRQPISKSLDKKFVNDFSGLVEQNLGNENFSVDEISKALGVSRVQLYRKVKALLDCSVTDYIINRRLKKAKFLLINERYTIAEITYMVGFSSPNYFSTVFKSKYGMRPSEFKRKQAPL